MSWNRLEPLAPCPSFFPLWLYSLILGLGRLHETFRFISVTRSRTVDRIPWTGDQLVARPLLTAPVIVMMEKLVEWTVLAGETEVLGETLPQLHFVHHKSHCQTRARARAATVGSQRLTASAMARPTPFGLPCILILVCSRLVCYVRHLYLRDTRFESWTCHHVLWLRFILILVNLFIWMPV
jgi:hypothetical protein